MYVNYDNEEARFGITFLKAATSIPYKERVELVKKATYMYLKGQDSLEVKTKSCKGTLFTENKCGSIGFYTGIEYHANIETNEGEESMYFLIHEQTKHQWN